MKTLFHFHLCNLLIPFPLFFVLGWKSHTLRRLIFKGIHFCNINFRGCKFGHISPVFLKSETAQIYNFGKISQRNIFADFLNTWKILEN